MSTSNNMGRTTQAQPKPGVNVCIVKKEITNKFNEIITNALAEQLVVLNKRKKDLYRWEETEKKEFLDIFGRNEIEANKWLLRGVEAMILVNQRVKSNCFKYQGDECIFAKVQGGISSENPVIVGPKFFHAAVKGYDSQVSTLCHEFSHLSEVLYNLNNYSVMLCGKVSNNILDDIGGYKERNILMLQAIKKIIIMTIVNIIFFYSFQSTADEMVLIKKYGFGLERDIKGRPLIYPIENYDECKKKCNHMNYIADANAQLAMSKKNNRIFANITFTNNSSTTYFFSKYYLPMKVKDGKGDEYDAICKKPFRINSGNITLDYLGGSCPFEINTNPERWNTIKPGRSFLLSITLNDMYAFIPGDNYYFIKSSGYKFVNDKWFTLKSINDIFLYFLNLKINCADDFFDINNFTTCNNLLLDEKNTFLLISYGQLRMKKILFTSPLMKFL